MNSENELLQRLVLSKKIMEKHDQMERGKTPTQSINTPMLEDYQPINAKYNLPQDLLQEDFQQSKPIPNPELPTADRIAKSKLPDEIKKLMIESPIVQPNPITNTTISDDVIEGAQRLMNINKKETTTKNVVSESTNRGNTNTGIDMKDLKSMIRDVVRDTVRDVVREELKDAGMIIESTTNTNEQIQFRVGKHLFIGKVSKIKKYQ